MAELHKCEGDDACGSYNTKWHQKSKMWLCPSCTTESDAILTPPPKVESGSACSTCGNGAMELFETQCEPCFKRDKVQPLMKLREQTLHEVARIEDLLKHKLEKLAKSTIKDEVGNLTHNCVCGKRFKQGVDFIAHLPECTGPARAEQRNGHVQKLMKIDANKIQEIG